MMHVSLMGCAIAVAIILRLSLGHRCLQASHWLATLSLFVVPPLLLITTALAIIIMGPHGHVVTHMEGWLSYGVAWAYLLTILGMLSHLWWQAHRSIQHIQQYPHTTVEDAPGRLLNDGKIFSAQVGLWSSELVISQGLLDSLDRTHLAAVIAHEQAHAYYHDTFWFFWLGWLQRINGWLPYTDSLWQELLLLREIRADRWALQSVEKITLAESLIQVISSPLSPVASANFSCMAPISRLNRRIDALLQGEDYGFGLSWVVVAAWIGVSLFPLLSVPFHY